jgi:DNA polymerase-3 subunit delta
VKFQNVSSFEKHLMASAVSSSYIIVTSDGEERKKLLCSAVDILLKKVPSAEVVAVSGRKDAFSVAIQTLSTRPLFSPHVIVKINDVSDFSKKEKEALASYMLKPSNFAYLVVGTGGAKDFSEVGSSAKNDVVILDLTQEKPWDKQRRLQQFLMERCLKEGKKISPQTATELLDACASDIVLLEQEILKIVAYVGERNFISSEDVRKVGSYYSMPTGWQMADALLWDGRCSIKSQAFDLSDLIPLLGQIRYHLNLARQVALLMECGASKDDVVQQLPQIRKNVVDRVLLFSIGPPC